MKINWHLYVFVQAIIALIAGILSYRYVDDFPVLASIVFAFITYFLLLFKGSNKSLIFKSLLVVAAFFLLGFLRSYTNQRTLSPIHYANQDEYSSLIGTVQEFPKTRTRTKTIIQIESVCEGDSCYESKGLLLVYFPKKDTASTLIEPGYQLILRGNAIGINAPTNPKTFDFKSYLSNRHIDYQVYLNETSDYKIIAKTNLPFIKQVAHTCRKSLISALTKHIEDPKKFSVAAAMILGYRNQLSDGLYKEFTNTGAVHVLAVSGLHVGIVCMIFVLILRRWKSESNRTKAIKILLLSLVIWSFVLLTGAAPAVVRAAFMFTLLLIGRYWFDHFKTINIMAFAAMVMLLYDPYMLFQASFQFSYISLFSIIVFQPWISKLWVPKSKILKYIWNLINVSIAAQVLVFPITLLFFHKFPLLFVLTGVVAVPLAMLVLMLGLALLFFHLISQYVQLDFLVGLLSYAINFVLDVFLWAIHYINLLPYSNKDGIWISPIETILLYSLIGLITVYVLSKKTKHLYWTGGLILLFLGQFGLRQYQSARQNKLAVYDSPKGDVVDIFHGRQALTYTDPSLSSKDISFIANNYRDFLGIKKLIDVTSANVSTPGVLKSGNVITVKDHFIYLGIEDVKIPEQTSILITNQHLATNVDYSPTLRVIILLPSMKKFIATKWKERFDTTGVAIYDANEEAVLLDL